MHSVDVAMVMGHNKLAGFNRWRKYSGFLTSTFTVKMSKDSIHILKNMQDELENKGIEVHFAFFSDLMKSSVPGKNISED